MTFLALLILAVAGAQELVDFEQELSVVDAQLASKARETKKALSLPPKPPESQSKYPIRLPSAEVFSTRVAAAMAQGGSTLTEEEEREARAIFGDSVDYAAVRVRPGIRLNPFSDPCTFSATGNVILLPTACGTLGKKVFMRTMIHELAHVRQFQTRGTAYMSDSVLHRTTAYLDTGKTRKAYVYSYAPGKALSEYTAEQEAQIIEDVYSGALQLTEPQKRAFLEELRAGRPVFSRDLSVVEQSAGLPPRGREPLPLSGWEPPREGAGVPQLEIRF